MSPLNPDPLARSYLQKCRLRLHLLRVAHEQGGFSDVVREAQELVELALTAVLRTLGVEVPKVHDVGPYLLRHRELLPPAAAADLEEIARISKRLRKERELAFYGADDFIPTEAYTAEESEAAIADAERVVAWVEAVLGPTGDRRGPSA